MSPSGALTYEIPVLAPPGTAGMQPLLSIVYSSQSGEGMLGQGLSISGLSSISRTGKNFYMDGSRSAVALDAGDNYALDGSRLIQTGLRNNFKVYDTENAGFNEIVASGGTPDSPLSFTVEMKDGSKLYYGGGSDARVEFFRPAQVVSEFLINRKEDANGNYIDYKYIKSGGLSLIDERCNCSPSINTRSVLGSTIK